MFLIETQVSDTGPFGLLFISSPEHIFQTCHKCSLWGPDQVLLLFKLIRNPIWPPWLLICWHTRSW